MSVLLGSAEASSMPLRTMKMQRRCSVKDSSFIVKRSLSTFCRISIPFYVFLLCFLYTIHMNLFFVAYSLVLFFFSSFPFWFSFFSFYDLFLPFFCWFFWEVFFSFPFSRSVHISRLIFCRIAYLFLLENSILNIGLLISSFLYFLYTFFYSFQLEFSLHIFLPLISLSNIELFLFIYISSISCSITFSLVFIISFCIYLFCLLLSHFFFVNVFKLVFSYSFYFLLADFNLVHFMI